MKNIPVARKAKPLRSRAARTDASVEALSKSICKKYKLPPESLKFIHPSGRKFRADATVLAVLKAWKITP